MQLLRARLWLAVLGREDVENAVSVALALAGCLPRQQN